MSHTNYQCCFCEKNIDTQVALLVLTTNYDKPDHEHINQYFFFHVPCLVKRMNMSARQSAVLFDIGIYKYECCICADYINEDFTSLITVSHFERPKSEQGQQQFYCHAPCIANRLSTIAKPYSAKEIRAIQNAPRKRVKNLEYDCCFCTKPIEGKTFSLEAVSNSEKPPAEQYIQQFFFHASCFSKTLGSKAARYYSMLFENEN